MEKIFNKVKKLQSAAVLRKNLQKKLARVEAKNSKQRVLGYCQYCHGTGHKKALVSYLVLPAIDELSGIGTPLFSNNGAGRSIPKVLNQLGYVVDVMNWDDTHPIEGEYDLVIYHGGKNFGNIKKLKSFTNKLVYYSTGSYWQYHNNQEKDRLAYFSKRHTRALKLDREIKDSEEEANGKADAMVVLGNADAAKTYSKFKNVYNLQGASMPITRPRELAAREDGKLGFLFMAGPGNLHKGLDIVLDAWKNLPEAFELHIITYLDPEFEKYYQKALYDVPNIKTYGYVQQRSKEYYNVIAQCQFSLLLSCSEGSPGSVIESLHQGLIPIVSKESHVDLDGHGYVLQKNTVEELSSLLKNFEKSSSSALVKTQHQVMNWAAEKFTVQRYELQFKEIIKDITK